MELAGNRALKPLAVVAWSGKRTMAARLAALYRYTATVGGNVNPVKLTGLVWSLPVLLTTKTVSALSELRWAA